jgi:BMFP domain-containing protein YqiC
MQTSNRLFDDLAKMASGALHTLGGLREEIETRVRERVERVAADMELVTREEFDAVRAMAAKARSEQEALGARLAKVEAELAAAKGSPPEEADAAAEPEPDAPIPEKKAARKPRARKAAGTEPDVEAGVP